MKYFFILLFLKGLILQAQNVRPIKKDSIITINTTNYKKYLDTTLKIYNPTIAIKRSAMLPGWGQYTNKKYWKIPLVYAGIGIPAYLFFRNKKQYNEAKAAFINATDGNLLNNNQIKEPYRSVASNPEVIRSFRNDVRQNVDYSVLFFIIFWGLNVADAAVDANLKTFDVSDEVSLNLKIGHSPLAQTNGISIVAHIGKWR